MLLKDPSSNPTFRHAFRQDSYIIYVKMPEGVRSVPLEVESSNTISSIKGQLRAMEGIPVGMQRLVFNGVQLDSTHTLGQCGIEPESKLELLYGLGGGAVPRP